MRLLITLIVSLVAVQALAQDEFKHEQKIAALVEPYLAHHKVNAISVGVIANGKTWTKNFGTLDTDGTVSPKEKTLYEIGSISKVFTSLLLAEAVESGRLKLDDPISTVMKELAEKNPTVGNRSHSNICRSMCPGFRSCQTTSLQQIPQIRSTDMIARCSQNTCCRQCRSGNQVRAKIIGLDVQPRTFDKEFKVDPEVAKRLEGKYELAPGIVITVQVKDGRMMAQLTGQQFLALIPQSETEWKYQLVDATLKFDLPESGSSPKVTLLQAGREMLSPRLPD